MKIFIIISVATSLNSCLNYKKVITQLILKKEKARIYQKKFRKRGTPAPLEVIAIA